MVEIWSVMFKQRPEKVTADKRKCVGETVKTFL